MRINLHIDLSMKCLCIPSSAAVNWFSIIFVKTKHCHKKYQRPLLSSIYTFINSFMWEKPFCSVLEANHWCGCKGVVQTVWVYIFFQLKKILLSSIAWSHLAPDLLDYLYIYEHIIVNFYCGIPSGPLFTRLSLYLWAHYCKFLLRDPIWPLIYSTIFIFMSKLF